MLITRILQTPELWRHAECSDSATDVQMGVQELCKPVQGNFLDMPFEKETFDGAYAIEATCHANKVIICS